MKRKFIVTLFELCPLGAGLFVVTAKQAPADLNQYLGRYIVFVLLFSIWILFRWMVPKVMPAKDDTRTKSLIHILVIGLFIFLMIAGMFLFNRRFERPTYELALVLIGINAFATRNLSLGRFALAAVLLCIYFAGLGFLSFQMVYLSLEWQSLVFSGAIGAASAAVVLSAFVDRRDEFGAEPPVRLVTATLFLAPALIGLLVLNQDLPVHYLTSFIFLPIIAHLPDRTLPAKVFQKVSILSALFIVNLAVLAILAP